MSEHLIDEIEQIIADTHDMDVTDRDYAKAIVAALPVKILPRKDAVAFIVGQFDDAGDEVYRLKKDRNHYGLIELRMLLDAIYGGPPEAGEELHYKTFKQEHVYE